jgi:hypothetical protein
MKRWHEERTIAEREWREHRLTHIESNRLKSIGVGFGKRKPGSFPDEVDCACDDQVGRFRKRRAHGCGKPGCLLCHGDKFPRRRPTMQERLAELRLSEQLIDLAH